MNKIDKILSGIGILAVLFIVIAVSSLHGGESKKDAERTAIKQNVTKLEHRFTERYIEMSNEFDDPETADFWYPREVAAMRTKKDGPGFYRVIIAFKGEARVYYGLKLNSKTGDYTALPIQMTAIDGSDVDTEDSTTIDGNIETN